MWTIHHVHPGHPIMRQVRLVTIRSGHRAPRAHDSGTTAKWGPGNPATNRYKPSSYTPCWQSSGPASGSMA
ncbi:hypothetical protein RSAG8_07086, partial [Rhizoctonia solani AG-8 WAC10335]